ncbi:MAG: hypothetical protein DRP08_02845 [Candidatus Aenigmatarchaeota archaeon]|nr:MAG: hypothetical protein DRP08_02845 [Candidatus Aenigmarchaeota archaeon]
MSEGESVINRLVELLAEEQTWQGKLFGHEGQAKVAEEEYNFAEKMIIEAIKKGDADERKYWERRQKKAMARKEYHIKQAEEARKKLADVRHEIKQILRRR